MKPIMPSNWKVQCRVLCTLLLGIAALWAMPRSAHAQLYVSTGGTVGVYDATTGAAINAKLITGLSGGTFFGGPTLALSGNNLFVGGLTVGKYDATMGVAINANFITATTTSGPLALSDDGTVLFVGGSTVGKYDAITGAAINVNLITGLTNAFGLALSRDGTALFVTNNMSNTVGEYNSTTGALINANFITGLNNPNSSPALSTDGT